MNPGPTVNSQADQYYVSISADELELYSSSNRGGGHGVYNLWVTTRETTDDRWGEPVNLGPTINSSAWEGCPNVSADGSTLFFRYSQSGRHGGGDIWQAPIIPVVDFNGDGQVDGTDVLAMAERWGTDDSLCDIGPMAWGDGIVDMQHLVVLAESIGEKVEDPTLAPHWALDEAEGMIASDRAGKSCRPFSS